MENTTKKFPSAEQKQLDAYYASLPSAEQQFIDYIAGGAGRRYQAAARCAIVRYRMQHAADFDCQPHQIVRHSTPAGVEPENKAQVGTWGLYPADEPENNED
jgi:hypothetical protein